MFIAHEIVMDRRAQRDISRQTNPTSQACRSLLTCLLASLSTDLDILAAIQILAEYCELRPM